MGVEVGVGPGGEVGKRERALRSFVLSLRLHAVLDCTSVSLEAVDLTTFGTAGSFLSIGTLVEAWLKGLVDGFIICIP